MSFRPSTKSRILCSIALVASTLAASLTGATAAVAATPDSDVRSGVYYGAANPANVKSFETWRGEEVGIVTDFLDASTWTTISTPLWWTGRWKGTGYDLAWGVPMLPKTGGTIQEGATGAYNHHFKKMAETMVAAGQGDAVLRIGWEMNGDWFAWSAVKDPDAYVAYWRNIVTTIRSVPGANFKFEWAPNLGEGTKGFDKTRAYPGDAYVDIIGTSAYNQSWAHTPEQDVERWNYLVNLKGGLQWHVDFAKAHGKPNAISEWALTDRCDGHHSGDDPYFVEKLDQWVNSHDYYYESYFNNRNSACENYSITSGPFPLGQAAYKARFVDKEVIRDDFPPVVIPTPTPTPTPTVPAPTVTPTPTPAPTVAPSRLAPSMVKVSWMSNRSRPLNADWMGMTNKVFIFVQPTFEVKKMSFYLDDPQMLKAPTSVENSAPWDFMGGTDTNANHFDASKLTPGKHTLTILFETPTGKRYITTANILR